MSLRPESTVGPQIAYMIVQNFFLLFETALFESYYRMIVKILVIVRNHAILLVTLNT